MPHPNRRSTDRELGEHSARLDAQQEDITDLKSALDRHRTELLNAIEEYRKSQTKYREETIRTVWMRRGALLVIAAMFSFFAWVAIHYPTIAEVLLKWTTHAANSANTVQAK